MSDFQRELIKYSEMVGRRFIVLINYCEKVGRMGQKDSEIGIRDQQSERMTSTFAMESASLIRI
jgi:hypothetical protein